MAKKTDKDITTPEGDKVHRVLNLPLTDADKSKRADLMAEVQIALQDQEAEKKLNATGFNQKIKELKKSLRTLSRQVKDGIEEKNVECTMVKNFEANAIEYWYEGEVVDTVEMTEEDRQQDLKPEVATITGKGKRPKKGKAITDDEVFDSPENEVRDVIKMETGRKTKKSSLDGAHPG